jgi:hypothetical protein
MTDLLDTSDVPVEDNTPEVKFEDLVGEGKKFKDQDAIVKKIVHGDAHISRLEREAQEMRETLARLQEKVQANDRLSSIEDLLRKGSSQVDQPVITPDKVTAAPVLDESVINKLLDQRDVSKRKAENVRQVKQKLATAFGQSFPDKVRTAADALGVGVNFLSSVAEENPQAFFRLIGLEETRQQPEITPPRSAIGLPQVSQQQSGKKDWAYYQKLKQSNPKQYHSVQTQWEIDQMAQRAAREGWDFGIPA